MRILENTRLEYYTVSGPWLYHMEEMPYINNVFVGEKTETAVG